VAESRIFLQEAHLRHGFSRCAAQEHHGKWMAMAILPEPPPKEGSMVHFARSALERAGKLFSEMT